MRSMLFVAVLVTDIMNRTDVLTHRAIIPTIVWVFFVSEMLLRFFPSKLESMGCQKQFKRNFEPIEGVTTPKNQSWKRTALVSAVWLVFNGAIGALYLAGIFDRGILILIAIGIRCAILFVFFSSVRSRRGL